MLLKEAVAGFPVYKYFAKISLRGFFGITVRIIFAKVLPLFTALQNPHRVGASRSVIIKMDELHKSFYSRHLFARNMVWVLAPKLLAVFFLPGDFRTVFLRAFFSSTRDYNRLA